MTEATMLDKAKMVGFIITNDYDAARAFYVDKLGFDFVSLDQFALVVAAGAQQIRIGKIGANYTPRQGTILGWEVDDIVATAQWLRGRGIPLEKFPFAQDQELGIWTTPGGDKVAWFKDPDGNLLSIGQHP
jgi:catechol 2,3-dioxygenase-like lactoylglutathione lyase family enzyme